jgi:hypothetical protein
MKEVDYGEMKTVCTYSIKLKNKQKIKEVAEKRGKNNQSTVVDNMVEDYDGE